MTNKVEKISLLSEMIASSVNAENKIKSFEYRFLSRVAKLLKVSKKDFQFLIDNPNYNKPLKSHCERVLVFYKFVQLTYPHCNRQNKEIVEIHNFGLHLGLNHESITRVLFLIDNFPAGFVPPDVLIDIFRVQYN